MVARGAVLMAMYGQGKTRGKVAILDFDASINQACAAILLSEECDRNFIFQSLLSKYNQIRAMSNTGGQENLNAGIIRTISIPLPPLPEQKAIASVLECWDKAIQKYEEKIEKKKNIKKGLMQKLLSGEQRLPGFDGEWEKKKIGHLGQTYPGLSGKTKKDFGTGKPFVSYMNVFSNQVVVPEEYCFVDIRDNEKQNSLKFGDILFTTSSETPNEVGMSSVFLTHQEQIYLNSFCFGFRLYDFSNIRPEYAQYLFRGPMFRKSMTRIAQGASRYNLSKRYFMQTGIRFPESLPEQKAIASVLSSADSEIKALKMKLALLRNQKKYLLNNLVTGTIRLPEFCKEVG